MADFEKALCETVKIFKISNFNEHQKTALLAIVKDKSDIFVNLPTGFGKSLIYQALPLVFDRLYENKSHIVVVISPLNLIQDQVKYLEDLGISAVNISSVEEEEDKRKLENGSFQLVYGTPEAWLMNERWRNMLKNDTYSSNLCAVAVDEAHVIKQWGTSTNNEMAPFRECYSRLHEFRTLAPSVPIIALTATATQATRNTIYNILMMSNPKIIYESSNKANVCYSVKYMTKEHDLDHYFEWLAEELIDEREHCERTIIYCQTIKQCSLVYATLKGMLGKRMYVGESALVEMMHSCTPAANKDSILTSFSQEKGTIRVLCATIAFGMGVNCKGVQRVIHFGPSKNIECYAQETGRAGRDGSQSAAYLLYNGLMLSQVEEDIKAYVMNDQCRRATILKHFDDKSTEKQKELHYCCDYCSKQCECGSPECGKLTAYPSKKEKKQLHKRSRDVTEDNKRHVHSKLMIYYKTLLKKLITSTANNVKTLTSVPYLLGFSEVQIQQTLQNLEHLFTLQDICELIEIWDSQHAKKILSVLNEEFGDTEVPLDEADDYVFDDEFLDDWEMLIEDDQLLVMASDNLSVSQLEDSVSELNVSEVGVPQAVLDTLEGVSFNM